MSNPGLKSSVKLETGANGSRLVDAATGRTLALSDTEAMLLEFWDGSPDAGALVKAATDASLSLEPHQVAVFFTRLSKAGFIGVTPPRSAEGLVAVPPLGPGDVVPSFRTDLSLASAVEGQGATQVRDGLSGRSFTLFDFELSIARMLDGKRTAAQVIDNAAAIGIPVSLESLRTFIGQLRAYRFLLDGAGVGPLVENGTWQKRRVWDAQTRALFQKALKVARESHPRDALPVLEALLAHDPEATEARAFKARVEAQSVEVAIDIDFEELHGEELPPSGAFTIPPSEALPMASSPSSAGDEVRNTMHTFDLDSAPPAPEPSAPGMPAGAPGVSMPIPQEEVERAVGRYHARRIAFIFALVVVVVGVAAMLRPVPWVGRVTATLHAVDVARPQAPRDGRVLTLDVRHGAEVKAGDVLAHLDHAGLDAAASSQAAALELLQKKQAQLESEPCDPKVRAREEARVVPFQKAVADVERNLEAAQALTDEALKARTLPVLEAQAAQRRAALEKAMATLEEYTQDKALALARADVVEKAAELEETRRQAQISVITSPAAGIFLAPANAVGFAVVKDGPFGRVVSNTARAVSAGPFPRLAPLPAAKLVLEVVKLQLANESWTEGETGRALQGTVDIHDGTLFDKPLELDLAYGERAFYEEFVGPK